MLTRDFPNVMLNLVQHLYVRLKILKQVQDDETVKRELNMTQATSV
jgi:hypothetical protein